LGAVKKRYFTKRSGTIKSVDDRSIDELARLLGAPSEKLSGIHIHKRIGGKVKKGDPIYTFYAQSKQRMQLAVQALKKMKILKFK